MDNTTQGKILVMHRPEKGAWDGEGGGGEKKNRCRR